MDTHTFSISEYRPKVPLSERLVFGHRRYPRVLKILVTRKATEQYFFYCLITAEGVLIVKDVSDFQIHSLLNRKGTWIRYSNPQAHIPAETAEALRKEYRAMKAAHFRIQEIVQSHVPILPSILP